MSWASEATSVLVIEISILILNHLEQRVVKGANTPVKLWLHVK